MLVDRKADRSRAAGADVSHPCEPRISDSERGDLVAPRVHREEDLSFIGEDDGSLASEPRPCARSAREERAGEGQTPVVRPRVPQDCIRRRIVRRRIDRSRGLLVMALVRIRGDRGRGEHPDDEHGERQAQRRRPKDRSVVLHDADTSGRPERMPEVVPCSESRPTFARVRSEKGYPPGRAGTPAGGKAFGGAGFAAAPGGQWERNMCGRNRTLPTAMEPFVNKRAVGLRKIKGASTNRFAVCGGVY